MTERFSLFEGQLLLWIQENLRTDFLTGPLCFLTKTKVTVGIIGLAIIAAFAFRKSRAASIAAFLSCVFSFLICNLILKNLVARARPFTLIENLSYLGKLPTDSSFPSGHASFSFAFATVMLCMLPKKAGIPSLVFALIIAFSRLYVGVHYPTDVLTGILCGTGCAVLSMMVCRRFFSSRNEKTELNGTE